LSYQANWELGAIKPTAPSWLDSSIDQDVL